MSMEHMLKVQHNVEICILQLVMRSVCHYILSWQAVEGILSFGKCESTMPDHPDHCSKVDDC